MNTTVIYGSRFGNTRKLAEEIAGELRSQGKVQLVAADEASTLHLADSDLIVVGCPTEGHRVPEPVTRFFERIGPAAMQGMAAAAFDTRLDWPVWLSGSAAAGVAKRLCGAGARPVLIPESFLVVGGRTREGTTLKPGELERARQWAGSLPTRIQALSTSAVN